MEYLNSLCKKAMAKLENTDIPVRHMFAYREFDIVFRTKDNKLPVSFGKVVNGFKTHFNGILDDSIYFIHRETKEFISYVIEEKIREHIREKVKDIQKIKIYTPHITKVWGCNVTRCEIFLDNKTNKTKGVDMKVKVIGGDGAFASDNSSFIINVDNKQLLFDCGPNAFNYIRENDLDIRDVYISHTHFDHIGGLEQLIFYNYFVKGNMTRIYCAKEVGKELKNILDINRVYDNGELVEKTLFMFCSLSTILNYPYSHKLIKGNHAVKINYGLLLKNKEKNTALFVSGDTKACSNIKDLIEETTSVEGYKLTVFHDYNEWDDPFKNVHCCKTDYEYYYSKFKDNENIKWYLYHNPTFNKEYKGKEIKI